MNEINMKFRRVGLAEHSIVGCLCALRLSYTLGICRFCLYIITNLSVGKVKGCNLSLNA